MHYHGPEIDSGERKLSAPRNYEAKEFLPCARQQQHDGDGDQKLRLEKQKSQSNSRQPFAISTKCTIGSSEAGQRERGDLAAHEKMKERRKSNRADGDCRSEWPEIRARLPDHTDAAAIDEEAGGDPDSRGDGKRESGQRDKEEAHLWPVKIGQANAAGLTDERLDGVRRDLLAVEFRGTTLSNEAGRNVGRQKILKFDIARAIKQTRRCEINRAHCP